MEHATVHPLQHILAPASDLTEARGQHRPFQHPCVKVLVNPGRGPESTDMNEGTVRVVDVALVRHDVHILDDGAGDGDPQSTYDGCKDVMHHEHCVEHRAGEILNDFVHQYFTVLG